MLGGLGLWLLLRHFWPHARNFVLISILACFLDLFTDILLVMSLSRMTHLQTEFALATLFVVLPVVVNGLLTLWIVDAEYASNKVG